MPRLPTHTAEVGQSLNIDSRRAVATDFRSEAAGELGSAAYAGAEKLLTAVESSEQRRVMVRNAESRAKYERRLQEAVVSGEDVDKIREEFETELANTTNDLVTTKGRETADYYAAESGRLFDAKANSVKVERAAAEAKLDGSKFLMAQSALLNANPGYLPQAERDIDNFVGTLTRLPVEQRNAIAADMKNNANLMAAMSRARMDPKGTATAVNSGAYTLSGEQIRQVIGETERVLSAQRTDAEYQHRLKERDKAELNDQGRSEHIKAIFAGTYDAQKAIADPRMSIETLEHVQTFARAWSREQAEGAKRSDPVVLKDLWYGVHAPVGDSRRFTSIYPIVSAVKEGKVSVNDGNMLLQLVEQQKDENARTIGSKVMSTVNIFENALGRQVKYTVGSGPQQLASIIMQYQADIYQAISKVRNEDNGDPHSLFDPTNKNYVGSQTFIDGSILAAESSMKAVQDAAKPKVITLPSGKKIRWTERGSYEDMSTWEEVK